MASNIPRLAVSSLAERLRVDSFAGVDIWSEWMRNDMDQLSYVAHAEALTYGSSYAIVWGQSGNPVVSVESSKQVAVIRDPGTREILRAVKRWHNTVGGNSETHAVVYYPDRIEKWKADQANAAASAFRLVEQLDNPLGVVPVVQLRNSTDRILDDFGCSEIDDLMPLVDAVNALLHGMMVSAEYVARPRRTVTGVDLQEFPVIDEDGQPVLEGGEPVIETRSPYDDESFRILHAEPADAQFGQLPAADLRAYENAVGVLLGQIMAVSALPAHYIGILTDNPSSADAIRSAEQSLTARAEARQKTFGRSWEQVGRLMVAVRDGVDPAGVNPRVRWADPGTRSEAQSSDSAVKLFQSGLLSRRATLRRLGFSDDEIAEELSAVDQDASNARDISLGRYMSGLKDDN